MKSSRKKHVAQKIEEKLKTKLKQIKSNSKKNQRTKNEYDVESKKSLLKKNIKKKNESTKFFFLFSTISMRPDLYMKAEKTETKTKTLKKELKKTQTRLQTWEKRNKVYRSIIQTYEKLWDVLKKKIKKLEIKKNIKFFIIDYNEITSTFNQINTTLFNFQIIIVTQLHSRNSSMFLFVTSISFF